MTDEELKKALIDTQDFILNQLPPLDSDHEFPRRVRKTVRKLIKKEMHPIWFEIQRVAAIFLIMFGIASVAILEFNEEVRASVLGWIGEKVSDNTIQYKHQLRESKDISQYTLADCLPDGYWLAERHDYGDRISERYANGFAYLFFTVMAPDYDGLFYVFSDDGSDVTENLKHIDGLSSDVYISPKEGDSNLIVVQTKDGICFVIQGKLEEEELIRLAEIIKN